MLGSLVELPDGQPASVVAWRLVALCPLPGGFLGKAVNFAAQGSAEFTGLAMWTVHYLIVHMPRQTGCEVYVRSSPPRCSHSVDLWMYEETETPRRAV